MNAALAFLLHERWFVSDEGLPTRWEDLVLPETLIAVGSAVVFTLIVTVLWHLRGRRPLLPGPYALGTDSERLAVLMGWVPLMLAIHTAVPLVVSGVQNQLFVPNLEMGGGLTLFVGLAEIGIALLLFYGIAARWAAVGLALVWLVGLGLFGPVLMLEQAVFLGIAAFFFIAGRGPLAVDRVLGPRSGPKKELLPWAVPLLRMAAGVGIAWLAFTEKLLNLPLALDFVELYPWVNFLPAVGLAVSDATFIRMAGTVELIAGLLLVSGAFPRLVILGVWLPFNFTLTAFGWQELVGHLPIYAVMGIVLLWGRGGEEDIEALRAGLIPRKTKPVGTDEPREG